MDLHRCLKWGLRIGVLACALITIVAAPAAAQLQVTSQDGQASIRFGFLLQGMAERMMPEDQVATQELYLRRMRLIFGGRVTENLTFFIDTDSPYLARTATTDKQWPDVFLQDAFVTRTVAPEFLVDAGLVLTPAAYNHLQSAASLLAIDYGPFTFVEAGALQTRVGRDVGVQARGILADQHVEYRVGVFQGRRAGAPQKPFRTAARIAFSPYALDPGMFYAGTYFGERPRLSFGAAADIQDEYTGVHGDVFFEQPMAPGSTLTLQGNLSRHSGGDFVNLPRQTTWLVEGAFSFLENRLAPYVQLSGLQYADARRSDSSRSQFGLAWRMSGHARNLKFAFTRMTEERGRDRDQILAQYQVFAY